MNLGKMIEENGRAHADSPAVIFKNKITRYNDLSRFVSNLAQSLVELGIKKGDKVAILSKNSLEFIISYFAIVKIGAVAVPLNFMLKSDELKFILEDSQSVCLIAQGYFLDVAKNLRLRLDTLRLLVMIQEKHEDATKNFYDLIKNRQLKSNIEVDENEPAAILYTSGTTGHPKGAILTHKNLISNIRACISPIGATNKENVICILPMFHSFAWTVCTMLPLYLGARTTVMEGIQPFKEVIKAVIKWRVSIFVAVPTIYSILAELRISRILRFPFILKLLLPVRLCISGAAALPIEVLKKFQHKFHIPLLEGYGLTEASPVVTISPFKGKHKPGSIGPALENVIVRVADERDRDVRHGEVGELLVKGPNVMKGYYNLEEETKATLKDGWLHTGDLAKMDEDGYVYIIDRKKDMINVAGLKVYPREVEEILYQHPKVKEAAVVAVKDVHKGEIPKAFVSLKENESVSEQELIKFCRQKIATYKVPHQIEFRESLPKTSTGKILKRVLK